MSGNSHLDSFIDLPHVNSSCVRIRLCDAKSTVMQLDDVVNPNARSLALQRHLCSSNPGHPCPMQGCGEKGSRLKGSLLLCSNCVFTTKEWVEALR